MYVVEVECLMLQGVWGNCKLLISINFTWKCLLCEMELIFQLKCGGGLLLNRNFAV